MGALVRFGQYIGTIRYLPMNQGLAPCDPLVRRYEVPTELLESSWEVGRLVLAPQYRTSPESLKRFLLLTLLDLVGETPVEHLFASCTPVLSRLYRRFGFSVMVKNACNDGEETYSLIHGHVPAVLRALAATPEERQEVEDAIAGRAERELLPC